MYSDDAGNMNRDDFAAVNANRSQRVNARLGPTTMAGVGFGGGKGGGGGGGGSISSRDMGGQYSFNAWLQAVRQENQPTPHNVGGGGGGGGGGGLRNTDGQILPLPGIQGLGALQAMQMRPMLQQYVDSSYRNQQNPYQPRAMDLNGVNSYNGNTLRQSINDPFGQSNGNALLQYIGGPSR